MIVARAPSTTFGLRRAHLRQAAFLLIKSPFASFDRFFDKNIDVVMFHPKVVGGCVCARVCLESRYQAQKKTPQKANFNTTMSVV